jgi:hypothetical protein
VDMAMSRAVDRMRGSRRCKTRGCR